MFYLDPQLFILHSLPISVVETYADGDILALTYDIKGAICKYVCMFNVVDMS